MSENQLRTAFREVCADLGAISALLGFEEYPGVDALLRAITDLIAAPVAADAAAPSEDRIDALQDMAFVRGLQMGFNFGENGARADYEQALKARDGYVKVLRETRAEAQPGERAEFPIIGYLHHVPHTPGFMLDDSEPEHDVFLFDKHFDSDEVLVKLSDVLAWKARATAPQATKGDELHTDDLAVDRFARVMKEKLAHARAKGRGGWECCEPSELSRMLREHVEKGDPRDVANFCMMLWHHVAPIGAAAPQAGALTDEQSAAIRISADTLRTMGNNTVASVLDSIVPPVKYDGDKL